MDTVRGLQIFKLLRFSFIILIRVLLAKTYLSLAEIGIYDTLLFISGTFTFFWISGLLDGLLAAYPKYNKAQQPTFLFNVFLLFVGLSGLVSLFLWFNQPMLVAWLTAFEEPTLPYFGLLCVFIAINIPTYLVEYIYLLQNDAKKIIAFGLFSFGGQALVVTIPIFLGYTLATSFWGLIGLAVLKFIWLLVVLKQFTQWKIQLSLLQSYLILVLPLVLYFLVGGIMDYVDKALVSRIFGAEKLAIYESGAKELPFSIALIGAMASALIPVVGQNTAEGVAQIKRRSLNLMHFLFSLSIVLLVISPTLFPIIFNPDFANSASIFNIYLLLLSSRILLPQTILIGLKKTKIILWASLVEVLINLGLSLWLLQYYGLEGIAFAMVIAFGVEKLILVRYTQIKLNMPLTDYLPIKWYLGYSILLFGIFGLMQWFYF